MHRGGGRHRGGGKLVDLTRPTLLLASGNVLNNNFCFTRSQAERGMCGGGESEGKTHVEVNSDD